MAKIIITIILVNIEVMIISTIMYVNMESSTGEDGLKQISKKQREMMQVKVVFPPSG